MNDLTILRRMAELDTTLRISAYGDVYLAWHQTGPVPTESEVWGLANDGYLKKTDHPWGTCEYELTEKGREAAKGET